MPLAFEGHFVSSIPPPPPSSFGRSAAAAAGGGREPTFALEITDGTFKWPGVKKDAEEDKAWQIFQRRNKPSATAPAGVGAEDDREDEVQSKTPTLDGLTLRIPQGDSRPRHVCTQCGMIHYQNPNFLHYHCK